MRMKMLVPTCIAILLAAISVRGQERTQAVKESAATAGNAGQSPAEIIQEPTVLGAGETWAVISWTTNAGGDGHSRIYAGTDPKNLKPVNETVADNPGSMDNPKNDLVPSYKVQEYTHLVRLNNLKPGQTYYFKADSSNHADHGTEAKSHTWTFTTAARQAESSETARSASTASAGSAALARGQQTSKRPAA